MARLAIAHEWLINRRGAERILAEFCRSVDDLAIYTLFWKRGVVDNVINGYPVHVSPLGRLPGSSRYYRYLLPLFHYGMSRLEVRDAAAVVSVNHAAAKAIRHAPGIPHVCYCLTPMRYVWEPQQYAAELQGSVKGALLGAVSEGLKTRDLASNDNVDLFVAISETVRQRIKRVYGRDAEVIYPCVESFFSPSKAVRDDFYLIVSALVPQKRLELAIDAFNRSGRPLRIAGVGPLRRRLEALARPNISFLGWRSDGDIRELYRTARALVFPGPEDFGLVPVEAQACGCPVIAFRDGGAAETVIERKSGLFFDESSAEALNDAVAAFEGARLTPSAAIASAARFSRARFHDQWRACFTRLGVDITMHTDLSGVH